MGSVRAVLNRHNACESLVRHRPSATACTSAGLRSVRNQHYPQHVGGHVCMLGVTHPLAQPSCNLADALHLYSPMLPGLASTLP